jgi:pyruvate/2-oxoglutarate dehydrogenase complex dihydrolipoamide dehydrogenase (E3) component
LADTLTPDLCVIGAGPAGLAVAEAARSLGLSVVIVDKGRLGGKGLHTGAVPARALAAAASHAHAMRNGASFGITADAIKVNFRRVHDHVDAVIAALSPSRAAPHFEALGAQVVSGDAAFTDKRTLKAGETLVRAHRFVLATGARPVVPAIPGLDAVPFFTTDTILDNTRKLTHLVIIGGGPLGLELAQSYARLGTEVTVLEPAGFLPEHDPELAAVALKRLEEEGVHLRPYTAVAAIHARSMGIGVSIRGTDGEAMLDVSHILVAVERVPDLDTLDLDKAGISAARTMSPGSTSLRGCEPAIRASMLQATWPAARPRWAAPMSRRGSWSTTLSSPSCLATAAMCHGSSPPTPRSPKSATPNEPLAPNSARVSACCAPPMPRTTGLAPVAKPTGSPSWLSARAAGCSAPAWAGAGAAELAALFSLALSAKLTVSQLGQFAAPYPSLAEIASRLGRAAPRRDDPLTRALLTLNRLLG